jgi:hypothetical protein
MTNGTGRSVSLPLVRGNPSVAELFYPLTHTPTHSRCLTRPLRWLKTWPWFRRAADAEEDAAKDLLAPSSEEDPNASKRRVAAKLSHANTRPVLHLIISNLQHLNFCWVCSVPAYNGFFRFKQSILITLTKKGPRV